MARKLKVYRTTAGGFFELAIAAPSMKAAAEAWGADPDVFKRGFAEETDDPKAVAAAMAAPGTVLRRPVGSDAAFSEHAALPKAPEDQRKPSRDRKETAGPARKSGAKAEAKQAADLEKERKIQVAAVERERKEQAAAREQEQKEQAAALEMERKKRAFEEKKREAERERARKERERLIAKANAEFEKALARHNEAIEALRRRREELQKDETRENDRWQAEQRRHEEALRTVAS